MDAPKEFVVVGSFDHNHELPILQMKFESEDIEYFLQGEHTVAVNPLFSGAVGGVRIAVHPDDAAKAYEIVCEHRRKQAEDYEIAQRTCPECGGHNGKEIRRPLLLSIAIVLTLGMITMLYPWARHICPDCGHRWQ